MSKKFLKVTGVITGLILLVSLMVSPAVVAKVKIRVLH